MAVVKAGLIQMSLKGDVERDTPEQISEKMIAAHLPLIEQAAQEGVQVLGLQELFNLPYVGAEQERRWYRATERVPDGPTVQRMRAEAARLGMALVVPVYEEAQTGVYYNTAAVIDADGRYLGKFRKIHIPHVVGFCEKFYFKPGDIGYPVFETAFCKVGVYICYDRHFPEGWRELAMNGAEVIFNPSATVRGLSDHLWTLEQPAAAVANCVYIGANNRVGREPPWNNGHFYGSSYFCQSARRDSEPGAGRPGRAGHRRSRPRHDRRGSGRVELLPRPPARHLRRRRVLAGLSGRAREEARRCARSRRPSSR